MAVEEAQEEEVLTTGSDLRYDLSISLEEAFEGKKQNIQFSTEKCNTCKVMALNLDQVQIDALIVGVMGEFNQVFLQSTNLSSMCSSGEEITNPCNDCSGQR